MENHGKVKVYAQVNRRKQRFKAKKSLITDEYEEELKTLKMWYCAYCEYEDNSQNGLKAHLSKGFHNAEDLHERRVNYRFDVQYCILSAIWPLQCFDIFGIYYQGYPGYIKSATIYIKTCVPEKYFITP